MKLKRKIAKFSLFKKNWDGRGTRPFTQKVLDRAAKIAAVLDDTGFHVFPTSRNSIQFEKEVGGTYIEIEVFEDREELTILSDEGDDHDIS